MSSRAGGALLRAIAPSTTRGLCRLPGRHALQAHLGLGEGLGQTFASSSSAGREAGLLREFLHDSLYHPQLGYFSAASGQQPPVASLPAPLDFKRLLGRDGYNYSLMRAYQQLQVSWLTPSEIFSPHYGRGLAECVLSHHLSTGSTGSTGSDGRCLEIFELGAGTGTVARDFLDYTREHAPAVYATMSYRTVEISESLAAMQRRKVAEEGGHRNVFGVEHRDAAEASGWTEGNEPCYVLAMEVMDNLPHDRVVWQDGHWNETVVEWTSEKDGEASESLRPVSDPYIQRCMQAFNLHEEQKPTSRSWLAQWMGPTHSSDVGVFLPTGCLKLMETLSRRRPHHRLLAADFSALPDVQIAGRNAPLVSTTSRGQAIDHSTYLVPLGAADIFFPTDFEAMCRLYRIAREPMVAEADVLAEAHLVSDFMYSYADWKATSTVSGYNPLLEDFTNTQILLGNMKAAVRRQQLS